MIGATHAWKRTVTKSKIPPEMATRIDSYVDKYRRLLKIADEPPPHIKIRNDPKANWLGRSDWRTEHPHTSTLELQKRLFKSPKHLERVIAHEMIHHRDFLALTKDEIACIDAGSVPNDPKEHPASFYKGAGRINAIMGPSFVVKEEALEDLPKYLWPVQARSTFSIKQLVLGFGGLALVGAVLLRSTRPSVEGQGVPARVTHANERGNYGNR